MMVLSGDTMSDAPKLEEVKTKLPKDVALRQTQDLFLEGRQINALYIGSDDELKTANQRKSNWLGSAHELLRRIFDGNAVIDFFDGVTINVVRDSDPIDLQSETFHSEMNQRLERLRVIRRGIEEMSDSLSEPLSTARRAMPNPRPVANTNVISPITESGDVPTAT